MKKILLAAVFALAALYSCSKPFESSIELGVNDTRIHIKYSDIKEKAMEFVIPVYSTGSWTCKIVAGGDWLSLDRKEGEGRGYIHCFAAPNTLDIVRAVRIEISNGNKTIPVYVVVSSSTLSAADIPDADLDNYLI